MDQNRPSTTKGDILVVDDDVAGLRALSTLLSNRGYDVRSATDGPTALMMAAADPPDLVLLDVLMPEMNGFELCERLKGNAALNTIPVIFVSGLDDAVDKVKGFKAGGADYITKPYDAEEVGSRVETHVTLYRLRRTVEKRNAELRSEIAERKQAQAALQDLTHELRERVKELNCLYGISRLIEQPGILLDEILQGAVDLIPSAWQNPEMTWARISMDGQEIRSQGFRETRWKQAVDLVVHGQRSGSVEVYCLRARESADTDPFLPEEQVLLDAISERLSRVVERYRANEALQDRVAEMATLHSVTQTLTTSGDLSEALGTVATAASELFFARIALLVTSNIENTQLEVLAGFERASGVFASSLTFSLNEMPVTRQVLNQGRSIVLPNLQSVSIPPLVRTYVDDRDLHALLMVPLLVRGKAIGIFVIGSDQPNRSFSPDEVLLAETLAGDVAATLENARLADEARAAAVDAERQRLARELHDSVTQSLYSMTLLSNGWGTMAEQGRLEDPAGSFRQLSQVGQQTLREMRLLIHQLRPPILEQVGLAGALQRRLEAVEQRAGIDARLLIDGEIDNLPEEAEEQLFAIAQEALNNALRHADPSSTVVRIGVGEDVIVMSVEDDGVGFDATAPSAGMGLVTMRERADAIGGQLAIITSPGAGTSVEITVALEMGAV